MYCRWWPPGSIILLKDRAKNGSDHSLLEILGANLGQREILPNLENSMAHNFPPFFSINLFVASKGCSSNIGQANHPHISEGQGVINNINSCRLQVSMTKKKRLPPPYWSASTPIANIVLAMFGWLCRWWSWWWYAFKEPLAQFLDVYPTHGTGYTRWMDRTG